MQPTLDLLLRDHDLGVQLVTGASPGDPTLAAPLKWAHSSDLPDPTRWLTDGGLLLTDGAQFGPGGSAADVDAYVGRLVGAGVAALGVSGVVHQQIPAEVVQACAARRLPLLQVAASTPFMAIIKTVNDATERDQRDQLERSLEAQRAVARAALRPDGLTAVLRELERRLDCWVVLFDGSGHRVPIDTRLVPPASSVEEVRASVRRALEGGVRAGSRLIRADANITLQTLGQPPQLRGVLVVGSPRPLEQAGQELVTSVIAIASIALDQTRALDEARGLLRAGLFELLLAGSVEVAGRSAAQLWGPLPKEPIRVCFVNGADDGDGGDRALASELELLAERRPGRVFFARIDGRLVTVSNAEDTTPVRKLLQQHRLAAGCSTAVPWAELSVGLGEARRAGTRAHEGRPFVRFDDLVADGVLGLLETSGGASVARRLLQPLTASPPDQRDLLLDSLRVWMGHNCAWDPAARDLGVHRHTLRNRVASVERLLGMDLDTFADRAELWVALELLPSSADVRPSEPAG